MTGAKNIKELLRKVGFSKDDITKIVNREMALYVSGDERSTIVDGAWDFWIDGLDGYTEEDFRAVYDVHSGDFAALAVISDVAYLLR